MYNQYLFIKTVLIATMALTFFGCGRDPEAMKENAIAFITAKNLEETVVGQQLQGASYIPGLEAGLRTDFARICEKCDVPRKKPFAELLKKSYDDVKIDVNMQTIRESNNIWVADDTIFKVSFQCKKTNEANDTFILYMSFVVANTAEGSAIMQYGGMVEVNGKQEEIGRQTLIGLVGRKSAPYIVGNRLKSLREKKNKDNVK